MKNRIVGVLIMFIGIVSCIDDVDNFNLPSIEPKLVVQSFITPNESIKVMVWQSTPINYNLPITGNYYDNKPVEVKNAMVVLKNSENTQTVEIPFIEELGMYVIPPTAYDVVMGKTYHLSVSAPGFNEVKASTTVPDYAPILTEVKLDTLGLTQWGEIRIILSGKIVDEANWPNFYALFQYNFDQYFNGVDTVSYVHFSTRELYSDLGYDGESIPFKIDYSVWGESHYNNFKISLYALSVDKHYYRFHKSLDNAEDFEDNPFAESSHLYSNIEGGLGVFASYLSTVIDLDDMGK